MFKYPEIITKLSENADEVGAGVEDLTSDLIHFALAAQVQQHFDEDGQLLDRHGLISGSGEFVKRVLMAVAAFTAAFCDEPTDEDLDVLSHSKTKH